MLLAMEISSAMEVALTETRKVSREFRTSCQPTCHPLQRSILLEMTVAFLGPLPWKPDPESSDAQGIAPADTASVDLAAHAVAGQCSVSAVDDGKERCDRGRDTAVAQLAPSAIRDLLQVKEAICAAVDTSEIETARRGQQSKSMQMAM